MRIGHFINGVEVGGEGIRFAAVFNPATGEAEAEVAFASQADVHAAIDAAKAAQPLWAAQNPQRRARVLMRFARLVEENMDRLANALSREHGKTLEDSRGDIQRGLEVVEFATGIPHLQKGEFTEGAGPGIDLYSLRQPVGIGAGITPFNFPAMVPLWMLAPAIACGNAFILKPSERVPTVPMMLARLLAEAGLPAGVFNLVNGDREAVEAILASPDIGAISFVGSTPVASGVYATAAYHGKRAQCFGGAKNHMIVLPDADMEKAADGLIGAGFGSAGERCMAVSVAVPVGEETADRLRAALMPRLERLSVGPFTAAPVDFGPVISKDALERIKRAIDKGVSDGAELVVDGRGLRLQGYENGYFLGPTFFDRVTTDMQLYREEIFGPVLSMVRASGYEDALAMATDHEYGNGVSVYTRDGDSARDFVSRVGVGMVGVNVPIPVPLAYHSFGGWKRSSFGDLNQHGPDSIRFWTRIKTVTSRWPSGIRSGLELSMPIMS